MAFLRLKDVQEKRAELYDQATAINTVAEEEKRDLTEDEAKEVDRILAEYESLEADEQRARKYEAAHERLKRTPDPASTPQNAPGSSKAMVPIETNVQKKTVPAIPRNYAKLRAFKGPDAEQDAYDAGCWLLAVLTGSSIAKEYCQQRGLEIRMDAQTVDDNTRGGFLVPTVLSRTIIRIVTERGVARRVSDVVPMPSDKLNLSKRSGGLTVYAPAEGAAITTSEMTWSQVSLVSTDRFTLTRVSNKLLRNAVVDVADRVAEEIGYSFADQQDNEWVNGDGMAGSPYWGETGLITALGAAGKFTAATGLNTWPELTLNEFHSTVGILPERYFRPDTSWLCSRAFFNTVIEKLAVAAGGNAVGDIAAGLQPRFLGYPVNFTDKMPTATAASQTCCLLGSWGAASLIGENLNITIASSEHRYFDSDEIALRGSYSYDINVHDAGGMSNAGAYVGLVTAAT